MHGSRFVCKLDACVARNNTLNELAWLLILIASFIWYAFFECPKVVVAYVVKPVVNLFINDENVMESCSRRNSVNAI